MKKSELSLVYSAYKNKHVEFYTSGGDPVCRGDIVSFIKEGEHSPTSGILTWEGSNFLVKCYSILIDTYVFHPVDGE
jgi:hypothetical protein